MTKEEKIQSVINFSKTLKDSDLAIFSDEDNLKTIEDIEDLKNSNYKKEKPVGLWFSFGSAWTDYLQKENDAWAKKRLAQI